jgi:hypothetical protein
MIQPLRAWHRRVFTALAAVLPITFGAAMMVRPSAPSTPAGVPSGSYQSKTDWKSHPIATRVRTVGTDRIIEVTAEKDILEPDLLVYLTATAPGKSLPGDARLLGSFRSKATYLLPTEVSRGSVLVLYSGARREVVDVAPLGVAP